MQIFPIVPRGYCKGVVKAIALSRKVALENPHIKITMLGMIVHNHFVVEACKSLGITCLDAKDKTRLELLDEIDEGIVIFTAHGVSDEVRKKARDKGLMIIDASCDDVIKTQDIIKDHLSNNYEIMYIGKKGHPEAEGALGLSEHVHLIDKHTNINDLQNYDKVLITNQTTMSIMEIKALIDSLKHKYPHAEICEEICNATRIRQEAILKTKDLDELIVVGDPNSNNSRKLKDMAISHGIGSVYMIEKPEDITEDMIQDHKNIGVTSGASTPTYITEQVITLLNTYAAT
ncbi:MAG: 4-hydroxy-3-methylbut-2-enyl diphosphate reductase, partial [Erysipelotrichaceae bacterium]|nr:4-hydroxy-3-methylbut-2-enyl diphosphate reductase [Erysipelotrichaceae bacterium]